MPRASSPHGSNDTGPRRESSIASSTFSEGRAPTPTRLIGNRLTSRSSSCRGVASAPTTAPPCAYSSNTPSNGARPQNPISVCMRGAPAREPACGRRTLGGTGMRSPMLTSRAGTVSSSARTPSDGVERMREYASGSAGACSARRRGGRRSASGNVGADDVASCAFTAAGPSSGRKQASAEALGSEDPSSATQRGRSGGMTR
jgi:hypothetical protein